MNTKTKRPKPETETCSRCGRKYQKGYAHLHAMFCRGRVPKGATCVECGESDHELLSECRSCGEAVCDACIDSDEHDC